MSLYLEKIRRCNTIWSILKEMSRDMKKYIVAYNCAPAFWNATQYSLQMCLITDIQSFLSQMKDDESLLMYFKKIKTNKNQIFTKKFYSLWRNEDANEVHEQEHIPQYTLIQMIDICESKLKDCLDKSNNLKMARNKIFCHITNSFLDIESCNKQILNNIKTDIIDDILSNLSYVIMALYGTYTNIQPATSYANQNDCANVFQILNIYDKYDQEIIDLIHKNIDSD